VLAGHPLSLPLSHLLGSSLGGLESRISNPLQPTLRPPFCQPQVNHSHHPPPDTARGGPLSRLAERQKDDRSVAWRRPRSKGNGEPTEAESGAILGPFPLSSGWGWHLEGVAELLDAIPEYVNLHVSGSTVDWPGLLAMPLAWWFVRGRNSIRDPHPRRRSGLCLLQRRPGNRPR
jgi:hypothetical protein